MLQMTGTAPDYAANKPGELAEASTHYDLFRRGPVPAYNHMIDETRGHESLGAPAENWVRELEKDPARLNKAGLGFLANRDKNAPLNFSNVMVPRFRTAYNNWLREQISQDKSKLEGAAGWLRPNDLSIQHVPHDEQMKFIKNYIASMPPELRTAENQEKIRQGLANNNRTYKKIITGTLDARDALKRVGITAGGAGLGGLLGHGLYRRLYRGKKDSPLSYWASVLGGTGLGGLASYFGGTDIGRAQMQRLMGR
jgi:hypothetical protein